MSIKGHNSVTEKLEMTAQYPTPAIVNVKSFCSQDIEHKWKSDANQGP